MRRLIMAWRSRARLLTPSTTSIGAQNGPCWATVGSRPKAAFYPNWIAYPRTRRVARGDGRFEEVELPGGVWIACQGDCAEAYRQNTTDFFDTLDDKHG